LGGVAVHLAVAATPDDPVRDEGAEGRGHVGDEGVRALVVGADLGPSSPWQESLGGVGEVATVGIGHTIAL